MQEFDIPKYLSELKPTSIKLLAIDRALDEKLIDTKLYEKTFRQLLPVVHTEIFLKNLEVSSKAAN